MKIGMLNPMLFEPNTPNSQPRGIRNNNPLNIIYVPRNKWKGLAGSDGRFCTFKSPDYGIRAAYKNLMKYIKDDPTISLDAAIFKWCPDNTHDSYIKQVSRISGILPWRKLSELDDKELGFVIRAMIIVENGSCPYPLSQIINAFHIK